MEARGTTHSKVHRLRERMVGAQLRHAHEVRADLPGIRVASGREAWFAAQGCSSEEGVVFFCSMAAMQVREVLKSGGRESPAGQRLTHRLSRPNCQGGMIC
jgi:hypothetical protein